MVKVGFRASVLAGLLASLGALPASAITEPQRLLPSDAGDARYRTVEWHDGGVIQLLLARGQSAMVEFPRGVEVFSILTSDQDVMTNTPPPSNILGNQQQSQNLTNSNPTEQNSDDGCTVTANLQTCIRRDRLVFFKPLTNLDSQPVPMIVLRRNGSREPTEHIVMFQIQTSETPYYGVRVSMPGIAQAITPSVQRDPRPAPSRAPSRQQTPAITAPTPPINNQYTIEGDRNLLGGNR